MLRPSKIDRRRHQLAHPGEVGFAELVPLGDDGQRVGAGQRVVTPRRQRHLVAEDLPRHVHRRGIERLDLRAGRQQPVDDDDGRRFAHVVGARLERQAPDGDRLALERAEMALDPLGQPHLLRFVHRLDGLQDTEVVVLVGGELDDGLDVLREAAAAVPAAREQERRPDPPVRARPRAAPGPRRRRTARTTSPFRS